MPLDYGKSNRVWQALRLAGVKQGDLAAALGMTQSYVSAVSNGRYQDINLSQARKFAAFFGAPIEVLFPTAPTAQEAL